MRDLEGQNAEASDATPLDPHAKHRFVLVVLLAMASGPFFLASTLFALLKVPAVLLLLLAVLVGVVRSTAFTMAAALGWIALLMVGLLLVGLLTALSSLCLVCK
ncbi:hypothetical protein [Roseateles flavus]|uniref:Uncharacterized protein n=1 Tax=Roseateles flavus TaxID=3149041 RepID=A0ABV0GE53_9BURK